MYGFCYHFNNLRFKQTQHIDYISAAHVVISFASSEHLECRLFKWLSDHPMRLHGLPRRPLECGFGPRVSTSSTKGWALEKWVPCTANLLTKILDFRGFYSSIILILRGGIPRPIGNRGQFPESSSQRILVGTIFVGRLGACGDSPARLNLLVSANGAVLRSEILGALKMKSYLSGARPALNND